MSGSGLLRIKWESGEDLEVDSLKYLSRRNLWILGAAAF